MSIEGYKLTSGEVVVGELMNSHEHTIELKNAVQLVLHEAGEGRVGIGMQPFIPFAVDIVTLDRGVVQVSFTPNDQIQAEFNRLFGSGLLLPDNKIVYN